jgi:hypothetical protein
MEGFIKDEEVHEIVEKLVNELKTVPPGFDFINDITKFKPASPDGSKEMQWCVKYILEHGLRHAMRVVGGNPISRMQFDRLARTAGSSSVTEEVASREEAERRLDVLNTTAGKK